MLAAIALATKAPAASPEVKAVRVTTLDFRPAVRVLTTEDVPPGEVVREGEEVAIRIPAAAAEGLSVPAVEKPLEAIRVEREPARTVVRVKVAPEVPFEASYEAGMVTVVFGEQPAPELRGPVTPDLYQRLFPTAGSGTGAPGEDEEGFDRGPGEGLVLGPVTLRPYVSATYINADVLAFENPVPVQDRYVQLAPGVTASMPLFGGTLAAEYEPRLRFFSSIPQVGETSHFVGVRLEMPVGSRAFVRLGQRFTTAVLETTVVDPGREYFYNLAQYDFWATTLAGRVDLGARLSAEAEAGWQWARFAEKQPGGFFDYDNRAIRLGLGYDVGSDLRATVSYAFQRIPPSPDRAVVETSAHGLVASLSGSLAPLTSASLTAGLRRQTNPLATGESASFTGVTLGGTIRRELGHSSSIELAFTRAVDPSSYDTNAYYVNNSVVASLSVPAPLEIQGRASVGYLRNRYPNDAPELTEPRQDDIFAWTLGAGRQLGWRAWLRADYRRERRTSNVPGLDVTTDGFVVQLGWGLFGPGSSR
jgi:hypothetical protein